MFAVLLLCAVSVQDVTLRAAPPPVGAWVTGLPDLLPAGTAFRFENGTQAGALKIVAYAAQEAGDIRAASERRRKAYDAAVEREYSVEEDGQIAPPVEEIPPHPGPGLMTVLACENGRLSCLVPRGGELDRPDRPSVAHIPLHTITVVVESVARYAERTGAPLPDATGSAE